MVAQNEKELKVLLLSSDRALNIYVVHRHLFLCVWMWETADSSVIVLQRRRKAGTSVFLLLSQYPPSPFFFVANTLFKIDGCSPSAGLYIAMRVIGKCRQLKMVFFFMFSPHLRTMCFAFDTSVSLKLHPDRLLSVFVFVLTCQWPL